MTAAVRPVLAVTFWGLLALALTGTGLPLKAQELECGACHDAVDAERFGASVHGLFACTVCHAGAAEFPHAEGTREVDCAACHADAVEKYRTGIHGQARAHGNNKAASCLDCHGDIHAITPHTEETSSVHWTHLAQACARCHTDPQRVPQPHYSLARPVAAYLSSVHARLVAAGKRAAVCSDCHGSHAIFPAADPRSSVFHRTVPRTCGACHSEVAATFAQSVHGEAAAHGVREAPVCTDCHGEHKILSPTEPGSPVFPTNIPLQTCGRCHADVRLTEKYGLPGDKVPAYEDTYHGLAARMGVQTVANCASCHGVHDILPSSDPRSHVNPQNLPQTCGQCHPGAGERFSIGPVHIIASERDAGIVYWVRLFYLPLIYLTIGLMLLHTGLDFYRKALQPHLLRTLAATPVAEEQTERMMPGFRLAHGLVMLSFPVLAYTGFALKYSETWWATPVVSWENELGLRGWLHRIAGVVLLASLAFHFVHLAWNRRARQCVFGMVPSLEDWHELKHRFRYYLGREARPPQGAKLGYIEKAEYLAFLWGMGVMGITGLVLWFDSLTLRWLPTWVIDASTAVHFYEAILATLAILVWHFYWVIFDPAVYPMDWSWLTGYAPLARTLERGELGGPEPAPSPSEADPPTKDE